MEQLQLADWRERVARLYLSDLDLTGFRRERDDLFATHPQSPVRSRFTGLRYFPPDPTAIMSVLLRPASGTLEMDTGDPDGVVRCSRVGIATTPYGPLTLWWIEAYGGGLFLPFRDATCDAESYKGGRYLTDTIKGTYGRGVVVPRSGVVRLDFNYAYNPASAYDGSWTCPLPPPENQVTAEIRAGELAYLGSPDPG